MEIIALVGLVIAAYFFYKALTHTRHKNAH